MNRLSTLCLALAVLSGAPVAWADDAQNAPSTPPASAEKRNAVLGQPETPPPSSNDAGQRREQPSSPAGADAQKAQEAQALFEESLRQMMPLDQGQIQEYRERSDQRERALLPVPPDLRTRTVRVALEPGRSPVPVYTTANVATALAFHDATGQPWPITSVTNGGPSHFQVLRPELPDGNLLNVMPTQGYATSTLVVTLESRDIPLVIRLESDSVRAPERKADALVLFQLAHHGPKAALPIIKDIKETADSTMLAFLDRVPPNEAVRVRMEPGSDDVLVWKYNNKHYVRTTHMLMWPAWTAVVNGAGNNRCYEVPVTSRVMLSNNGQLQTLLLKPAK
ncbi:DotH/IcmK family type IV secretion protein [Desulfovibrio sp.]|uniref:DotH/IcmK family type IV secretion protein n=1 Tax=Desulfovibrio sp. TaxID=885 RepID=UPI0025B9234D|nr:DotH/IcmK family type IV secretion protein [Desulfovibrio sp.]